MDQWFLEGRDDEGNRWTIKLDSFPFLLGRSKHCNFSLTSSNISREHSRIYLNNNEIFIEDCNSTNGTMLNGRKISDGVRFYENDKLNICGLEFKLIKETQLYEDRTIITSSVSPLEVFGKRFSLTPRECELLGYLTKGLRTKEIAASMFISPGTAKNHILNLLKKTGTHTRLELIRSFEDGI